MYVGAFLSLQVLRVTDQVQKVIGELEHIYKIPQAGQPAERKLHVTGSSLFNFFFHSYNSKDSPEEREDVQREIFSKILTACQNLRKMPIEVEPESVRRDPSLGRSSITPPPTSIKPDLQSQADGQAAYPSPPPSEYRPTTPLTKTSQMCYERIVSPRQTPPRSPQQTPPRPPRQTPPRSLLQTPPRSTRSTPTENPHCKKCGYLTDYKITRQSNRNGNAGRPYFKCDNCGNFHSFADTQGISQQNPYCPCGEPSRLERAGWEKGNIPFFVCATGTCAFYREPGPQRQTSASPIPEIQGMSIRDEW
jgi:hypothetical protein